MTIGIEQPVGLGKNFPQQPPSRRPINEAQLNPSFFFWAPSRLQLTWRWNMTGAIAHTLVGCFFFKGIVLVTTWFLDVLGIMNNMNKPRETYQWTSIMRCVRGIFTWLNMMFPFTWLNMMFPIHNSYQDCIWAQMGRYSKSCWFMSCSLEKHPGLVFTTFGHTNHSVVPTFGFDRFLSCCWSILRYFW